MLLLPSIHAHTHVHIRALAQLKFPRHHPHPASAPRSSTKHHCFRLGRSFRRMTSAQAQAQILVGLENQKEVKKKTSTPRRDFKEVEAERPPFEEHLKVHFTKTKKPDWVVGSGASDDEWKKHKHVEIDPYEPDRPQVDNYKLLISGIVPRPIGFISSINPKTNTPNLAPFSYTNLVNYDPPIFSVGFSHGRGTKKDTCVNLLATGECVINIISESFIEAANYCCVNSPIDVSEWELSGLTPAKSSIVKPARVAESVFSIEGKLVAHHEWESPAEKGRKTGITCLIQGVNFWVREDAINEEKNMIDVNVLRPVSRLGGITYGRLIETFELPRPDWEKVAKPELERIRNEKAQINGEKEE